MNKRLATPLIVLLLTALFGLTYFFQAKANPDPGPPTIIVSKSLSPEQVPPNGKIRITIEVKGDGDPQQRFESVDVMHLIDMSGSMAWFGDVFDQSGGSFTEDWVKIREFNPNGSLNEFDVLLQDDLTDQNQFLRLKSPLNKWYGYQKSNFGCASYTHLQFPGADYLKIASQCNEEGVWEVWAKGKTGRSYNLVVGKPPARIESAKQAAKHFVSLMQNQDQIGLVSFSSYASVRQFLTLLNVQANRDLINSKIDSLDAGGATAIGKGIDKAINYLDVSHDGRAGIAKAIILLSDGRETENSGPLEKAQKAKEAGIKIFTIGLGQADEVLLKQIADITSGQYFKADSGSGLQEIYNQIARTFSNNAAKSAKITAVLPEYIEYIGNPSEPPASITQNADGTTQIVWDQFSLEIGQQKSFSFDVKVHKNSGRHLTDLYPDTQINFIDWQGQSQTISFPETFVQVLAQDAPTISKSVNPAGQITPGDDIAYLITYGNSALASTTVDIVDSWSFASSSLASYVAGSASQAYGNITAQVDEAKKTITWPGIILPPKTEGQSVTFKLETNSTSTDNGTFTIKNSAVLIVDKVEVGSSSVENSITFGSLPTPPSSTLPGSNSSSGSGVGSGFVGGIVIFNEQIKDVTVQSATLSWQTNLPAFCRLLYDSVSHSPNIVYGMNFGYTNSIDESTSTAVTFHSITLDNLNNGGFYYWRAACRRPNEIFDVVNPEQKFITLADYSETIVTPVPSVAPFNSAEAVRTFIKGAQGSLATSSQAVATTTQEFSEIILPASNDEAAKPKVSFFAGIASFAAFLFSNFFFWLFILLIIILIFILMNLKRRK